MCGAFLQGGALRMQAEVARMQEQLALPERQRLPQFYQVSSYLAALVPDLGLPDLSLAVVCRIVAPIHPSHAHGCH